MARLVQNATTKDLGVAGGKEKITVADRVLVAQGAAGKKGAPTRGMILLHEYCDDKLDKGMVRKNPFLVSR